MMLYPDVHIVFGDSAAGTLKAALRDLGIDSWREKVIGFADTFSIGPVWRLHEKEGLKHRLEWLNTCLTHEPADNFADWYMDSFRQAVRNIKAIDEGAVIAVWSGDNAHDQTGVRFILHLLRKRSGPFVLANAAAAYRRRFQRFDPLHLGEMSPEKLGELIQDGQLFQPLDDNDRALLVREWETLAGSHEVLRIWQNGEIVSVPADYLDSHLIQAAQELHSQQENKDFMKAARLIGEVLGHLEQHVGDEFLEYRLRCLIEKGVFLMEGSLEAMRMYSVKLA